MEKVGRLFDRFSASIHERHWLEQDDLPRIDASGSISGAKTSGAHRNVAYLGDTIHDLKSNIMPAHTILSSRVAQAHDDLHIWLFFGLLPLFLLLLDLGPFHSLRNHYFRNLLLYHGGHDCGDGEIRV